MVWAGGSPSAGETVSPALGSAFPSAPLTLSQYFYIENAWPAAAAAIGGPVLPSAVAHQPGRRPKGGAGPTSPQRCPANPALYPLAAAITYPRGAATSPAAVWWSATVRCGLTLDRPWTVRSMCAWEGEFFLYVRKLKLNFNLYFHCSLHFYYCYC